MALRKESSDTLNAAMRIHLSGHPELVTDLRDHLRSVGCIAVQVAPDVLEATIPDAPSRGQERRELRAYLATWTARRGVEVDLEE
jgi:trans-aconitate methyltransferase